MVAPLLTPATSVCSIARRMRADKASRSTLANCHPPRTTNVLFYDCSGALSPYLPLRKLRSMCVSTHSALSGIRARAAGKRLAFLLHEVLRRGGTDADTECRTGEQHSRFSPLWVRCAVEHLWNMQLRVAASAAQPGAAKFIHVINISTPFLDRPRQ